MAILPAIELPPPLIQALEAADAAGPDIEVAPLDEQGTRLRNLLLLDLDKCHCRTEMFDWDNSKILLFIGERGIEAHDPEKLRCRVPLRLAPLRTKDLEDLFIEAARLAEETPLCERDLDEAARLVPEGSGLEGIEVRGLPYPIAVSAPDYLGQYVQNYERYGAFLQVNSVQRL